MREAPAPGCYPRSCWDRSRPRESARSAGGASSARSCNWSKPCFARYVYHLTMPCPTMPCPTTTTRPMLIALSSGRSCKPSASRGQPRRTFWVALMPPPMAAATPWLWTTFVPHELSQQAIPELRGGRCRPTSLLCVGRHDLHQGIRPDGDGSRKWPVMRKDQQQRRGHERSNPSPCHSGARAARTRNLEIPGSMRSHRPGITAKGVPAARKRPSFVMACPSQIRGRRECRVLDAPAASRANDRKHTSQSPQVHRNNPAFPAQWFTAYSALFPVTGLVCHRRLRVAPQA